MKRLDPRPLAALCGLFLMTAPAAAQDMEDDEQQIQQQQQSQQQQAPGQVAESSVGQVGQRQTRDQPTANIEPMGRINNRIANRVQNRIRNRIDRHYDPTANATSPFEVAEERTRNTRKGR